MLHSYAYPHTPYPVLSSLSTLRSAQTVSCLIISFVPANSLIFFHTSVTVVDLVPFDTCFYQLDLFAPSIFERRLKIAKTDAIFFGWSSLYPVSYTHLDVYKRQLWLCVISYLH